MTALIVGKVKSSPASYDIMEMATEPVSHIVLRSDSRTIRRLMKAHPLPGNYGPPPLSSTEKAQRLVAEKALRQLSYIRSFFLAHPLLSCGAENSLTAIGEALRDRRAVSVENCPEPSSLADDPRWNKNVHQLVSETGKSFVAIELSPAHNQTNGKTVVLLSGLGMSAEGYFRIGEEQGEVSIIERLIGRGFRLILLDFPGLASNKDYPCNYNDIQTATGELFPSFASFLSSRHEFYPDGLFFLAHSLGGLVINRFLELHDEEIKADPNLAMLFKNVMVLGGAERPLPDIHPIFPLLMAATPAFIPFVETVPYQSLKAAVNKVPASLLIGGDFSLVSADRDFPPARLKEMLFFATKNFSTSLGRFMIDSFWRGRYYDQPPFIMPGQNHIRLVGHNDGLSPVEGLYARLMEIKEPGAAALFRIRAEGSGVAEALSEVGRWPILGVAVDNLRHLDCSCPNPLFEKAVWPIVLRFLGE